MFLNFLHCLLAWTRIWVRSTSICSRSWWSLGLRFVLVNIFATLSDIAIFSQPFVTIVQNHCTVRMALELTPLACIDQCDSGGWLPNKILVSRSIPKVWWSPGIVTGCPNGNRYAAVTATRNLGEANIMSMGCDPRWWVAGHGLCGWRFSWMSVKSMSAISWPRSFMGLRFSTSLLASRHSKTSWLLALHVLTCWMRSSMNCCYGWGFWWPLASKLWNCWSYAILAPNCGGFGPTQYPETMM